jgi:aryl-alcohol dehydrogenase-like predicted oxidoreductase
LARLAGYPIDLHQIHSPLSFSGVRAEMEAMADLVEAGKIRSVGVSNYNAGAMRRAHGVLAKRGIPLASNQVLYSMINRKVESNGIMEVAKDLGVTIIAYSPVGQGILTGAYHQNPELIQSRPGPRKRMPSFSRKGLERTRPLVEALREIGEGHGATPVQVALNWLLSFHGETVVAIPGASRPSQVEENLGAVAFRMGEDELTRLDELSRPFLGR